MCSCSESVALDFASEALATLAARDFAEEVRAAVRVHFAHVAGSLAPVDVESFRDLNAAAPVDDDIVTRSFAVGNLVDRSALALPVGVQQAHVTRLLLLITVFILAARDHTLRRQVSLHVLRREPSNRESHQAGDCDRHFPHHFHKFLQKPFFDY